MVVTGRSPSLASRVKPTKTDSAATRLGLTLLVSYILLLYGVLEPVSGDPYSGAGFEQIIWTLTYVVSIAGLFADRRRAWQLISDSLPIVLIVGVIVASASWSDYHDISLKRGLELVGTTATAYFVAARFRLPAFLRALSIAAGSAALISLVLIVFDPSRGLMQDEYAGAWQGIFVHKNSLGQAMALGLITLIICAYRDDGWRPTRLQIAAMTLCLALLIGSQSATSYLMFATLAVVVISFKLFRSPKNRRWLAVPITAAIISVLIIALDPDSVMAALGRDSTLSGRTDIWPPVMDAIANRPWFGYGYDTFWLPDGSGSAYMPVLLDWIPYHAHNGLLELSLDVGLVGAGTFLLILFYGLRKAARFAVSGSSTANLWPLVAMIYFVVGNITEANIAKFNGMNWVIFVIAFLYVSVPRDRHEKREAS